MNAAPVIKTHWTGDPAEQEALLEKEWLVTNGLGGYASGTLAGVPTRRYHSVITASLPAPQGRYVMLNHLSEWLRFPDGGTERIGGVEWAGGAMELQGTDGLREFRLESGVPVWRYELRGHVLEKWILMPHLQNTVHVGYRLLSGTGPLRIELRVAVHFRGHGASLCEGLPVNGYDFTTSGQRYEIHAPPLTPLRLHIRGVNSAFTRETKRFTDVRYRVEEQLGYEAQGDLWSPGYFRTDLSLDGDVVLMASLENWETILALDPTDVYRTELQRRHRLISVAHAAVRHGGAEHLVLAADQFIVTPAERLAEMIRTRTAGDELRTVIAGYHWFTDWGRDTMISLEGLTLLTGRYLEAGHILRTFSRHMKDGLIPNLFPEGEDEGVYHTVDATLWFFHALDRYVETTGDKALMRELLPRLLDSVEHHIQGTRFGIRCDPTDGLLTQGDARFALTWMDAKVGDWVITPRRGKAVEINALWYNALRTMQRWLAEEKQSKKADEFAELAQLLRHSFNRRFWNDQAGYLFDVVDGAEGDDTACRPNQLFAISLPNAVLEQNLWQPVVKVVRQRLLTPVGLRTLSPDHPDFKTGYYGDLRTRDAAYHQGTVWPWLIGPYIDAWLRAYPEERAEARRFLELMLDRQLTDACVGSVSEIYDAQEPCKARGCIAQAWSVAELLRAWVRTAGAHM